MGYPTDDQFEEARRHRAPPRKRPTDQYEVTLKFDFSDLYTREDYDEKFPYDDQTYENYRSSCRETTLKAELTRLRMRLKDNGYTHGEIVRAFLDEVRQCCKNQP